VSKGKALHILDFVTSSCFSNSIKWRCLHYPLDKKLGEPRLKCEDEHAGPHWKLTLFIRFVASL